MSHGGAKPGAHHHAEAAITDITHTDSAAIHDNVAGEINAITAKTTPASGDLFLIEDSAAANVKKKATYANLPSGSSSDAIHGESAHDSSHDTNSSNWGTGSDTEAWNHALTVTAGDIIIVEWGFAFDDLGATDDPQGFIELDNGTQQLPTSSTVGWVVLDHQQGYFWIKHMFVIESTSKTAALGWQLTNATNATSAPDITAQGDAWSNQYTVAWIDSTNDFTGSVTLRGFLTDEPGIATYYEEHVLIRHQAAVT